MAYWDKIIQQNEQGVDTTTPVINKLSTPTTETAQPSGYWDRIIQNNAQKPVQQTVTPTPKLAQSVPVDSYFYNKFPSGATVGRSDQLDTSGRPLFAYRNPGDTATTTDKTRVATTFDPTKAQPLTKEQYYNPRMEGLRDDFKKKYGIDPSQELDHAIALTVGGSNQPENLRAIPAEQNQKAGTNEMKLARDLVDGKISYFDAQIADAKNKGVKIPWVPPEIQPKEQLSWWDKVKNFFTTTTPPNKSQSLSNEEVSKIVNAGGLVIGQAPKKSIGSRILDALNIRSPQYTFAYKGERTPGITSGEFVKLPFINKTLEVPKKYFGLGATLGSLVEWPERVVNDIAAIRKTFKGSSIDDLPTTQKTTVSNFLQDMNEFEKKAQESGFSYTGSKILSGVFGTSMGIVEIIPFGQTIKSLLSKAASSAAITPIEHYAAWEAIGRPATIEEAQATRNSLLVDLSNQTKNFNTKEASDLAGNINKLFEVVKARGIPTQTPEYIKVASQINEILDSDIKNISATLSKSSSQTTPFIRPAGLLPGYVPEERAFPAGLSTQEVKPVGFEKAPTYQGETDLSIKILEQSKGRATASKQFFQDLTNQGDIKQPERDIIRYVLNQYPDGKDIPVKSFAEKVKTELLPLNAAPISSRRVEGGIPNTSTARYENITLPADIRGDVKNYGERVYQSPIRTSAGDVHYAGLEGNNNYFGHTRIEDMADGNTRRVIETQSDLYQKGRIKKKDAIIKQWIESEKAIIQNAEGNQAYALSKYGKYSLMYKAETDRLNEARNRLTNMEARKYPPKLAEKITGIEKLAQYTNPTAHFRMVREEVKRAAIDGKTKLQFPTGETAMKIEGLGQSQNNWKIPRGEKNTNFQPLKVDDLKVGQQITQGVRENWIITDVLGDGKFKAVQKSYFGVHSYAETVPKLDKIGLESLERNKETFDISGKVDTNNPIYRFYEKDLGRYIKNNYNAKLVTDSKGVTWWQVDISKDMAEKPVLAFRKGRSIGYDRPVEEVKKIVYNLIKEAGFENPAKSVQLIFSKEFLPYFADGMYLRSINPRIAPIIKIFVEKNGTANVYSGIHESGHFILDPKNGFITEKAKEKLLSDAKDRLSLYSRLYYRIRGYDQTKMIEEKVVDEWAKQKASGMGFSGPLKIILEAFDQIIKRIVNIIKNTFKKLNEMLPQEGRQSGKIDFFADMGESQKSRIEFAKKTLAETEKRLTKNEEKTIDAFSKSSDQKTIGSIQGKDIVLGTFGKNAIERKISTGKSDRLPISELPKTIPYLNEEYKAGTSGFRKDNIVHVGKMTDGERRAVVTRVNNSGQVEVINFFKIGRNYYNFINNLKSFGIPTGTRTQMTSLEPKQSIPLTYGDNNMVPKITKKVNETDLIHRSTKQDRIIMEKAHKEIKRIQAKENLAEKLKIKLPQDIQNKALELELRKEELNNNPLKNLIKYMSKTGEYKGRLREITGKPGASKFSQFGDRYISEATGIEDTEEARAAFDKYISNKRQFERDMANFSKQKSDFYKKARSERNKIIENQKVGASIERTDRHIKQILGNEKARKERIEKVKKKEEETQQKLKDLQEAQSRYERQVKSAHLNENQKKSLIAKFKSYLSPIAQTDKTTQKIYFDWETSKIKSKEDANKLYEKYAGYEQNELPDIIEYEAGSNTPWIRNLFDDLYTQAKQAGLPVDYKENYIPHVYKEKPEQIQKAIIEYMKDKKVDPDVIKNYTETGELPEQISVKLKIHPTFTKIRTFPDYKTAMEYGLTPRFRTVAEHAAYYVEEMGKTLANRKLIDELIANGKVLDAYDAPDSWIEIKFPGRQFRTYYGPKDLADSLNGQFRDENSLTGIQTIMKYGAKTSKLMQEIALSAGIPGTTINFFAIGQAVKMLTTGVGEAARLNIKGASTSVKAAYAFVRANFSRKSIEFFKENQKYIDLMSNQNISLTNRVGDYALNHRTWKQILTSSSIRDMKASLKTTARDIKDIRSFKDTLQTVVNIADSSLIGIPKDIFDKMFNEKTFNSFMPQMQLQVFKDTYNGAVKAGADNDQASKFAADIIKAEFGLINSMGRTKTTSDALSSVFFAPKFREGIINVFKESAKSYTTQFRNASYSRSRAFVIGTIVTFALYDFINRNLNNGDDLWDNEPGHEFDLKIPLPNGRIIYTPFLPSVFSFVRNMGSSVLNYAKGNTQTALQKAGTLFSMPAQMITEIVSNKDYFGRPIYDQTDSASVKARKALGYMGLSFVHPFFSEFYKYFTGKQDIYQTLSIASELPLKFSTQDKATISRAHEARDTQTVERKNISNDAVMEWDRLKSLKNETEFNTEWDKLAKSDPELAKKVSQISKDEKKGLTSSDRAILWLGVENKARAKFLVKKLKSANNEQEYNSLWDNYVSKKIITKEVAKQINELWNQ